MKPTPPRDRVWFPTKAVAEPMMMQELPSDHRDKFPEQYEHRLVGQRVEVRHAYGPPFCGTVQRVVEAKHGPLAYIDSKPYATYRTCDCFPVAEPELRLVPEVELVGAKP